MVPRGRRVSLYGRLRALEGRSVVCRSCAEASGLHVKVTDDESGMVVAMKVGDHRAYCDECGRVPNTGITLTRGRGREGSAA